MNSEDRFYSIVTGATAAVLLAIIFSLPPGCQASYRDSNKSKLECVKVADPVTCNVLFGGR